MFTHDGVLPHSKQIVPLIVQDLCQRNNNPSFLRCRDAMERANVLLCNLCALLALAFPTTTTVADVAGSGSDVFVLDLLVAEGVADLLGQLFCHLYVVFLTHLKSCIKIQRSDVHIECFIKVLQRDKKSRALEQQHRVCVEGDVVGDLMQRLVKVSFEAHLYRLVERARRGAA